MKQGRFLLAALAALVLAAPGASAQDRIRIGVLTPNTGPFAVIGEDVRNGFQLYFDQTGGKAGGAQIEVIYEDSQAKPDVGLTKAKKLVESDGVAFISGIVSSSVAYAVRDYMVQKEVPLIVSVASADGLTQELAAPNVFRTNGSGSQNSHPFGKWLADKGYKRVIIVAPGYAMGFEQTGGIARTFTEAGSQVVQTLYPPLGTPDFAPFLTSMKVDEADAVVAVFAGSDAIKFVKQYEEYGLKEALPLVGTSLLTDDLILEQQGDAALGIITASHYSSEVDTPANAEFVAAYREKFGRVPNFYSKDPMSPRMSSTTRSRRSAAICPTRPRSMRPWPPSASKRRAAGSISMTATARCTTSMSSRCSARTAGWSTSRWRASPRSRSSGPGRRRRISP